MAPAGGRGGGPALPHPGGGFSRRERRERAASGRCPTAPSSSKAAWPHPGPGLDTLSQVGVGSQTTPPAPCAPKPQRKNDCQPLGSEVSEDAVPPCPGAQPRLPALPQASPSCPGAQPQLPLSHRPHRPPLFSDHSSCLGRTLCGHTLGPLFVAKDKLARSWHSSCRLVCEINERVDKLPLGSPAPRKQQGGWAPETQGWFEPGLGCCGRRPP